MGKRRTRGISGPDDGCGWDLGRYRIDQQGLFVVNDAGQGSWLRRGKHYVIDRDTDEQIAGPFDTFDEAQLVANPLNRRAAS